MFLIEFESADWIGEKHIADLPGIIPQHSMRHKLLSVQTEKQATYSAFWALIDVENQSVCQ